MRDDANFFIDEDGILQDRSVRFRFNERFREVFTTKARYIDIWGGRAGGRSHFGTEYYLWLITQPHYFRGMFLRQVAADIRDSLFQDFKDRIEDSDQFEEDEFEINETKMTITYLPTGNTITSKGFKKSSGNRSAKLKSIAGYTHILVEEADENGEEEFNKLDDSIRTNKIENIQIILLHNAPPKNHWITRRFYDLYDSGLTDDKGRAIPYYIAYPKQNMPDVLCIFNDYLSNYQNLNAKTISKYEEYGRRGSPFFNEEHYYVDILGLIPEGVRGRIYKGWYKITPEFFDKLPYETYYGLDFGFSGDPVALVAIKSHNNRNFYKQIIYETDLTNIALVDRMKAIGIPRGAKIYADSAEPKSIQEMKDLGYRGVRAADAAAKGPDSIAFRIKKIQSFENYLTNDSEDAIKETENYKWDLDENNQPTTKPKKGNDHAMNAIEYGVVSYRQLKRTRKVTVARTSTVATAKADQKKISDDDKLSWA